MQMLQSDRLIYYTVASISVQWMKVVFRMGTFSRCSEVSEEVSLEILLDNSIPEKNEKLIDECAYTTESFK